MDYKKIVRSQQLRFLILKLLKLVPDKQMIKIQYKIKLGRKLDLKNPKRYSEKLQWYKLYYRNPLMTQCSDKYNVREYVESKGLESVLVNLYQVCDNADEINPNTLPQKFVIKTTNGSGTNFFCNNKSKFNIEDVKYKLNNWMKRNTYSYGREWAYKDIAPKIIVEEYLEDKSSPFHGINDYKFLCFNGKVKYIVLDVDRHIDHKRNIYDINWNKVDVSTDHDNFDDSVPKPEGFDEMVKVANILSEDFPCVRVDLYWVNGKVYFGELTFYPWTGYIQFEPDQFDYVLGQHFKLPKMTIKNKG